MALEADHLVPDVGVGMNRTGANKEYYQQDEGRDRSKHEKLSYRYILLQRVDVFTHLLQFYDFINRSTYHRENNT